MANEIDIQLQNSSAFGQLQQGFAGIERNMASIVVTLDKIVKASKQAEESQKKAAEGPIDSIKKARDAVRSYQKQVEEAGKGTPQLASALMKLADARAELTRQERAAAMTMNTNRGMLTEYKAVGSAVSAVNDNLKEMYQTMRSSGSSTGMTNVAASVEKVNQALEKTVQLQQTVNKQTSGGSVAKLKEEYKSAFNELVKLKSAEINLKSSSAAEKLTKLQEEYNAELKKTIMLSQQQQQIIDTIRSVTGGQQNQRVRIADVAERSGLSREDMVRELMALERSGRLSMYRLDNPEEITARDHRHKIVTPGGTENYILYESERDSSNKQRSERALQLEKEIAALQSTSLQTSQQLESVTKEIATRLAEVNRLNAQIEKMETSAEAEETAQAIQKQVEGHRENVQLLNKELSVQQQIVKAIHDQQAGFNGGKGRGNMSIARVRGQLPGVSGDEFDVAFQQLVESEILKPKTAAKKNYGTAGNFISGSGEYSQVSIAEREKFDAMMRSMQAQEVASAPADSRMSTRQLYEATRENRNARRSMQMEFYNQSQGAAGGGYLYHTLMKEAESDRKAEMDALRNQIQQRYAYEPLRTQQDANVEQSIRREAESDRQQEMSALRNQIEQRYAYEPNKIQQNAAVGQMLSREAEDARAQEMLALRNQIQQRYVYEPDRIQQNASIGHMMNRDVESERAQQMNRLKNDIIERYSQPVESSPEFFDKRRRDLMQERSRIPAGDTAAIKKNVEDLRNLELQANRANQTYKTLNATMASQAQAGTASEYEEKISALKTLQNTVAGNTSEYKRLGAQIKQTENEFSAFKGDIIAVAGSTDKLESEVKELQASINKLEPNTPEWKRMNDELFTTKRRLQEVNDQTKQYQKMQGKGWFGRTFMTPIGNGGGNGGAGGGLAGFGGTAMGQVKTLAATYLGLYEGINAVVRELEHGKEALRHQFEKGIIGQQEVVKQAATLGNDMLGPMKKWAQENQGELMTSQENILNLAGFTKQIGITDIDQLKAMTELSLKVSRGDVETARGLQQMAVLLLKTQNSDNIKGGIGQARQFAEASAGVNELILNKNVSDRLVTMSIKSRMQQIEPLSVEQILEHFGAGTRTFGDTEGDTMSRAQLVGFDSLLDFKPKRAYKGTRVSDDDLDAYKNAKSLQERFMVVANSKELSFQFAKEKASRQGPMAETIEKMFTADLYMQNLNESKKLITSLDDASRYLDEQQRVVEDNTKVLGIVNKSLMAMNEAITTDKATAAGSSQGIMDRVAKIDLAGWDAKDRGVAAIVEHNAQVKMLADGGGYNEAMLKLMNVQSLIKSQQEKGVQEENPIMQQLRAAEDGLAALADQMNDMMTPAEKELKRISSILESMKDRPAGHVLQGRKAQDEFKMLLEGQRKLSTPEGRGEFNRKHEEKKKLQRDIQDVFNGAVQGAAGGAAKAAGGGLFSVPPEQLMKAVGPQKPVDHVGNVRNILAEMKKAREAEGGAAFGQSTMRIKNGALAEHMRTGKVGANLFGAGGNGSSLEANALAGQLRGRMGEIDPALLGSAMRQANGYNGFTAAMNDPNRLTPDEKLKIAKESAKRYMQGGDAGDPTGLGKRFGKGSPIGPDSAFVNTGKTWWEREQAAQSAGNVRLDMAMPEGSARAVRAANEKMELKRRLKAAHAGPGEEPLTKKQLATPEGRAEQRARDIRDERRGNEKLQSAVDPEMKDILKALAMALNAFEAKSKSQPEVRIARIPTPRQPAAASVS